MNIEQIYTGCLAQGAYYITSNGEAAIIDPLREVTPYINRLKKDNVKLKYIFETHFHADFVSGHISLASQTNAPIVYGPTAKTNFDAIIAKDNQEFEVGNITIVALHTPGHTMESTTYLLKDEEGKNKAIFTGDTLFLGDVGRPDLAQGSGITTEDLAGILYDSLRNKIMPLEDNLIIYPGHGAGSACGKNMSKETVGTLGEQKKTNYALRPDMDKSEFIKQVTSGIAPPPKYFPQNVAMNKTGYPDIDSVLSNGLKKLTPNELEQIANSENAIILDVRTPQQYAAAHIPGSIFIGIKGDFAPWVGAVIGEIKTPLLLIVNEGDEIETITRLARVGFDNTLGYLYGGISEWQKSNKQTDFVESISAKEFQQRYLSNKIPVFDVRKDGEFFSQHIPDAHHTPLSEINNYLTNFPKEETFYVHCQGGYRSMIAASILKKRGYHNLVDIKGGFNEIVKTGIVTEKICINSNKKI